MQTQKKTNIRAMAEIAIFTAFICIISPIALPIGPVPVTLGTFAINLATYVLGWKKAALSCLLYLLLGLVGLPVFSGFTGGIAKVLGPTGGYMIGYLAITLFGGYFIEKANRKIVPSILALLGGAALNYTFGTLWLAWQGGMGFVSALLVAVVPFIIGDVIKVIVAVVVGYPIYKRLQ